MYLFLNTVKFYLSSYQDGLHLNSGPQKVNFNHHTSLFPGHVKCEAENVFSRTQLSHTQKKCIFAHGNSAGLAFQVYHRDNGKFSESGDLVWWSVGI